MVDEKHPRMYTRKRGEPRERHFQGKDESVSKTPYTGQERRQPEHVAARSLFDKYRNKMGISEPTLRTLFQTFDTASLEDLEEQVATAQLSRIGMFGSARSREYRERMRPSTLAGMEGHLLEFALKVKPMDTLYELIDMNLHVPAVRRLCEAVMEGQAGGYSRRPKSPRVAEIARQYGQLIEQDVSFLVCKTPKMRKKKIDEIYEAALECFGNLRDLIAEGDGEEERAAEEDERISAETRSEEKAPSDEPPTRITRETIKKYRRS